MGDRIGYKLNGAYWYEFDERGLEAVNKGQKIIITADSKTTTARLFDGKSLIKSADAKCHPDDKFDFEIGTKIAFDRLVDREEKVKPKELLKNGFFGKTNEDEWFVFVDGMFVYENGNYDIIEDINENLIFCYKGSIRPVNVLVKSNCFKNAKLNFKLNKDVIWRRHNEAK